MGIADEVAKACEEKVPEGYRLVPVKEFAKRRRHCMQTDNWKKLDGVSLYDTSTGEHMSISCQPYCWRIFVEPEAARG